MHTICRKPLTESLGQHSHLFLYTGVGSCFGIVGLRMALSVSPLDRDGLPLQHSPQPLAGAAPPSVRRRSSVMARRRGRHLELGAHLVQLVVSFQIVESSSRRSNRTGGSVGGSSQGPLQRIPTICTSKLQSSSQHQWRAQSHTCLLLGGLVQGCRRCRWVAKSGHLHQLQQHVSNKSAAGSGGQWWAMPGNGGHQRAVPGSGGQWWAVPGNMGSGGQ